MSFLGMLAEDDSGRSELFQWRAMLLLQVDARPEPPSCLSSLVPRGTWASLHPFFASRKHTQDCTSASSQGLSPQTLPGHFHFSTRSQ